jgi:hypothetical protein
LKAIDLNPEIPSFNSLFSASSASSAFQTIGNAEDVEERKSGVVGRIGGKIGVEWSIGVLVRSSDPLASAAA